MIVSFGEVLMDCLPKKNIIGGAPFNVAINLKRMGNEVKFMSRAGTDEFGEEILNLAQTEKLQKEIQKDNKIKTGIVSVQFEDDEPLYTIEEDVAWNNILYREVKDIKHLIYGSLATFKESNRKVFKQLRRENKPAICICDLNLRAPFYDDKHIIFCLKNADLLKVNEEEWNVILTLYSKPEKVLIEYFRSDYDILGVIVTRGNRGASYLSVQEKIHVKSEKISDKEFKDTIGAGDGFLAAFLNEWIISKNNILALEKGIAHASKICKNVGAILPS
jgi:fructokinase